MLEVLDPSQNSTFQDHYLGVPFDLSQVLFIATANVLDTIPPPLQDRMEILELPGYIEEDKLAIAKGYLVRRQTTENGLTPEEIIFTDDALREIVRSYTREAGVRQLERELGSVCRAVATRVAEGLKETVTVDTEFIRSCLGPPKFLNEIALRTSLPGVATGLACCTGDRHRETRRYRRNPGAAGSDRPRHRLHRRAGRKPFGQGLKQEQRFGSGFW